MIPDDRSYKIYEGTCKIHGPFRLRYIEGYQYYFSCPECDKDKQIKRKYGVAYIPDRFVDRTFDNFNAVTEEQKFVLQQCIEYANRLLTEPKESLGSLILSGNPGTGKTHLACAIANKVLAANKEVLFVSIRQLIKRVRASWDSEWETEMDVIKRFTKPFLLILDELGVQTGSDNEKQIIFDVINDRYNSFKPMIVISNEDLNGVESYLGIRTFDRLCEKGTALGFTWESYRRQ